MLNSRLISLFSLIIILLFFSCDDSGQGGEIAGEMTGGMAGDLAGDMAGDMAGTVTLAGMEGGEVNAGGMGGEQPPLNAYVGVWLNEINAQGEPFDWVEIINLREEAVDLSGCSLSDDLENPDRFVIPAGEDALIPAGGFALFILSPDSTGFALGSSELILLSSPDGQVIDMIEYEDGASPAGGSYGRLPDGTGMWQTLFNPSPAAHNDLGSAPVCGDAICAPSEDCPEDCTLCGDGLCDEGEVCPMDCSICGDGLCDEGEMCTVDCTPIECGDGICSTGEYCNADCVARIDLVINEIVAFGTDGIEVVNVGEEVIELDQIFISDDPTLLQKASLSGQLQPDEYLWIEVTDNTLGFKLASDEAVYLSDVNGAIIDSVDWEEGDAPEGQSYRRIPDLVGDFQTGSPSLGEAND